MTDIEMQRIKAICDVAGVDDIGKLSDGFHTFNSLYEQRLILFAALVKAYKNKAWKSYRHEDGEYCFGGGWFIVGIDTPEGSYTYHYENKYWDMFDCIDLPRGKHWDGHTEADAETRLMSLEPERTQTHSCDYGNKETHGEERPLTEDDYAYCAECDHVEMCRWYPMYGCEFKSRPSAEPIHSKPTDEEIQKMQELEQAEIEKAYELGRQEPEQRWIPCSDCERRCENWEHSKTLQE